MYNWEEWRAMVDAGDVTYDVDGVITGIVNALNVQAYRFTTPDNSGIIPSVTLESQTGNVNMYTHALNLSVQDTSQAARNNVDIMRVQPMVAIIIKNNGYGEIWGQEQGMILQNVPYNSQDPVTGNMLPIELATDPEGAKETHLPATIFNTDAATTKALILGLETPGV